MPGAIKDFDIGVQESTVRLEGFGSSLRAHLSQSGKDGIGNNAGFV